MIFRFLASSAVLLALTVVPAAAGRVCVSGVSVGVKKTITPKRKGQYWGNLGGAACVFDLKPGEALTSDVLQRKAATCDAIGPVHIGMAKAKAKAAFANPPWKVLPRPNGEATIHLVVDAAKRPVGYIVVETDGSKVTALQLTAGRQGSSIVLPIAFSSIRPGEPAQRAIDVLGPPLQRCTGEDVAGELWKWGGASFTIEIAEELVYSIRIE